MKLPDNLRRAGWGECPSDEVRQAWEAQGGRWQVLTRVGVLPPDFTFPRVIHPGRNIIPERFGIVLFRPVHPSTWDYDARGWGEDMTPTEPGWYWWRDP